MIKKVISGGQIGADIAGLRAAKACGIATGGYAPNGWKTKAGPQETLLRSFGLVECIIEGYPERTKQNVLECDATVRLAHRWDSHGELATLRELFKHDKSFVDIRMQQQNEDEWFFQPAPDLLAEWLERNNVLTLNIAGNADRTIERVVEIYLTHTFKMVNRLV